MVGEPGLIGGEARIGAERVVAKRAAEALPLLGVHDHDGQVAVLSPERLCRRHIRVTVALPPRSHAGVEVVGDGIGQERHHGGEEIHVEVLAGPRAKAMNEGGVDAPEGQERRREVRDGSPRRVGGSPGIPVIAMIPLMPCAIRL